MARLFTVCAIIGAMCLALGGAADPALAGMSVSPLKQEITVKPGEVGKVTVAVWNGNTDGAARPEAISVRVLDVKATEEGGLLFAPIGKIDSSAGKWITPTEAHLNLEPNQSEQLVFSVSPPQSAPPGEYYAAVLVATESKPSPTLGVNVQFRIASGIFLTIPGRTFPKQAKIERCELLWPETPEPSASQPAAATQPADLMPKVSVLLHNTGRARFEGSGKVQILDAYSREVFSAPLTARRECVFGGDSRLFEAIVTKPLAAGKYRVKAELDYQSAWGKARYQVPIEVLPDQADSLAARSKKYQEGQAPVEIEPAKVSVTARAGATRSLALAVRNVGEKPLQGAATVAPAQGSPGSEWITVAPAELAISKAGRKTVAVRVQVPAGTAGGTYTSAVILKVGSEGSPLLERVVPVEIEVQAEK